MDTTMPTASQLQIELPDGTKTKRYADVKTSHQCQELCQAHDACKFFLWRVADKVCFHYKTDKGKSSKAGRILGPKECGKFICYHHGLNQ